MEMNFPHAELHTGAFNKRPGFEAYMAKACLRQGNSHTALAMQCATQTHEAQNHDCGDNLVSRIRYFAGSHSLDTAKTGPYGAFLPKNNIELGTPANYDQAVYQNGLDDGKLQGLFVAELETVKTQSGQEN
jgi:hypothetical protein